MSIQNKCAVSIGSVTLATRAARALSGAAIYSEITKFGDDSLSRGCSYGLEFSCSQKENVMTVLRNAGIRVRGYIDGEGGGRL